MTIALTDIVRTAIGSERLPLTRRNGKGITVKVGQATLLRTEITAVRHLPRS